MKKFDVKKLLVFILIIAILVAAGFFALKLVNKNNVPKENKTAAENNVSTYYLNLTKGFSTVYSGLDVLYSSDKTTLENLGEQEIVYTALSYIDNNDINYTISAEAMADLKSSGYEDLDDYQIYSGESVRTAVKELFDLDTIVNTATPANFLYDINYDANHDCYLVKRNDVADNSIQDASMDYSIISTEEKNGKLIITIAIAYVLVDDDNIMYMKDSEGTEIVVEGLEKKEFPKDKIDEFTKYKFTLKETTNKKYVFESVEKIK